MTERGSEEPINLKQLQAFYWIARLGSFHAGDGVEQSRLAGAVGPDQPGDPVLAQAERRPVEGADTAERLVHVDDGERVAACPAATLHNPLPPAGL
jgi:hypothetical protein